MMGGTLRSPLLDGDKIAWPGSVIISNLITYPIGLVNNPLASVRQPHFVGFLHPTK